MHCSDRSQEIEEPLAGTAPEKIHTWLLIEYPKAWPAKFKLADLDLPSDLKVSLAMWSVLEGHKCLLIRRPKSTQKRLFWITEKQTRVVEQQADLKWSMQDHTGWTVYERPFVLVCTHGSRDRCCGTLGGLVFATLHRKNPSWVWQCSHLGGHRFAPTVLTLPDGMLYGRISADNCSGLLSSISAGTQWLPQSRRGNTRVIRPVQALEVHLAKNYEKSTIETIEKISDHHFSIVALCDSERQRFALRHQSLGIQQVSCGDGPHKEIGTWVIG